MTIPIVIVQPNENSFLLCRKELSGGGFTEKEDFLIFRTHERAGDYIVPGEPQVLVCGLFNGGDKVSPSDFVRRMKHDNPKLTAIAFSVSPMEGDPWDISITKVDTNNFCGELIPALRKFVPEREEV
jgi:hypothetical protein